MLTFSSIVPRRSRPARGFALLIVITLLAFMVVLLLGLAVYTRVETAVAGNTQRQAQARENALLALNVALGQLQQHAGPDTRVTATAAHFNAIDGTRHYTGVWSSNATETDTPGTPRTWLVSGNELRVADTSEGAAQGSTVPAPLAIKPDAPGTRTVDLVGRNATGSTSRNADYVVAPLIDIPATGVPGTSASASTTVGRYAWWVGDQGVKAPVAIADSTDALTFAPYDSAELRSRIRQQLTLGAGPADATSGEPVFEPRDTNNASLVGGQKVLATSQLAFLRTPANAPLGLARVRQNLHAWSPNNFAVLADTKNGGLRQDLSLKPDLLGVPFAAWANYSAYMEKLKPEVTEPSADDEAETPTTTTPAISPAYGDDPMRRRYVMTPHLRTGNTGGSHQVGPVLTYFLLTFNVRTEDGSRANRPLEVRARWLVSLWNPYTSALVPETLQADVTGLPTVTVVDEEPTRAGPIARVALQSSFGGSAPFRINLPWNSSDLPESSTGEDRQSWLPGRVYTWRSNEDTSRSSAPPEDGYASAFYSRTLSDAGDGVIRTIAGATADGSDPAHLEGTGTGQVRIRIYAKRADGTRVQLGDFRSPQFLPEFTTETQELYKSGYQFSYIFRLAESIDTPAAPGAWLTTSQRDPRLSRLSGDYFILENGDDPAVYNDSNPRVSNPGRLFDRAENALSYNEDVPLFELPRAPLISMGALQHFRITASRPFMIGNSWGVERTLNGHPLNALFDRFFFSGVVEGLTPETNSAGDLLLPNPLLKTLRKANGSKVTVEDIRATSVATTEPPPDETPGDTDEPSDETTETTPTEPSTGDSRSSKYFLQSATFNLNSSNAAAWAAVLRGVRFPAGKGFNYLNVSDATGTAEDAAIATVESSDAQFFRFSQSAQETYKAEPGQSAAAEEGVTPPNTHLVRRGMRTLSATQVKDLAAKIVELLALKHAATDTAGGPFRSIEEFLAPSTLFAGIDAEGNPGAPRSLLEAAIADAGINAEIAEFSSQWLTQGDVMTALAPILFARSDTFVIRTYGEAVNPTKLPVTYRPGDAVPPEAIEGRAWAEAIVQRVPEYFDPSDPPETLAPAFDAPSDPDDPASSPTDAHKLNKLFGRRFKVVSFRWLTRSDI